MDKKQLILPQQLNNNHFLPPISSKRQADQSQSFESQSAKDDDSEKSLEAPPPAPQPQAPKFDLKSLVKKRSSDAISPPIKGGKLGFMLKSKFGDMIEKKKQKSCMIYPKNAVIDQ